MEIDIQGLNEGYYQGDFTIKEITQAYLDRIEEVDFNGPQLRSIIQINPDALSIAEQLDKELSAGKIRGPYTALWSQKTILTPTINEYYGRLTRTVKL